MEREERQAEVIDMALRLGALGLLVAACFWILAPFLMAVSWGAIIAIAIYPIFRWLVSRLGGHDTAAATILTACLLALLVVPAVMLAGSLLGGAQAIADEAVAGLLKVPPPPESIAKLPLVGEDLYEAWAQASMNLESFLRQFTPQIRQLTTWLLSTAAGTGFTFLQFVLSIAIAGVLLARADSSAEAATQFSIRLVGREGEQYANIAATTVQSVTRGVLGVAVIQSMLVGVGFFLVGLPAAGLLTLVCIIVGIMQLPLAIITIPAIFFVFSTESTTTSVLFLVWNILVTPADNVLKPILLGRGAPVPTMVIFLGSLGGFVATGLIGLFVGAIVLSLGFVLYQEWLEQAAPASS